MIREKPAQYLSHVVLSLREHSFSFSKIIFSIILAFLVIISSFFIPGIKDISANDNSSILICINPGHGGRDFGAIGASGLREKDVNLDIAVRLKNKLTGAGFRVIMTREDDTQKSIEEIVNVANSNKANLFISIHNNSHISAEKNGTETFYSPNSPGGNILASRVQLRTIEQIGTVNRGIKSAEFRELKNTTMTSALVEGAFISNPNEEANLNDASFRDRIAAGVYNGIMDYIKSNKDNIAANNKIASAQSFIRRVYHKSLNTEPDQTILNDLTNKLASGTIKHTDIIRNVIISSQFENRNLTNSQFIAVLYSTVLDRDPDEAGLVYWLNELKMMDRKTVLNYFLLSSEFLGLVNHYIKYGYNYSGTISNSSSNNSSTTGSGSEEMIFKLSVLNGAGTYGIAAKTSELLKGLKYAGGKNKYDIGLVSNASNFNYQNTQIICKSDNSGILKAAEEIKNVLKTGIITVQNGNSQISDIIIIIGKDFSFSNASTEVSNNTGAYSNSGQVLVNVLNGNGSPGVAARFKLKIETSLADKKDILKVTETKNAGSFGYKSTRIIIYTTKTGVKEMADNLKNLLGVGEIRTSSNNVDNVDITVILGSDYNK